MFTVLLGAGLGVGLLGHTVNFSIVVLNPSIPIVDQLRVMWPWTGLPSLAAPSLPIPTPWRNVLGTPPVCRPFVSVCLLGHVG